MDDVQGTALHHGIRQTFVSKQVHLSCFELVIVFSMHAKCQRLHNTVFSSVKHLRLQQKLSLIFNIVEMIQDVNRIDCRKWVLVKQGSLDNQCTPTSD
jgi:hypothetical protein